MTGALLSHVSSVHAGPLQPMNANFGLLPSISGKDARERQARRAIEEFGVWANETLETSRAF
jgi:folate-dependent tRNA-U54 methylase TrmFO/GidA